MKVSSRTFQEILNTKAYYIARKALWFTPKAGNESIQGGLGRVVRSTKTVRSKGFVSRTRRVTSWRIVYAESMTQRNLDAPLAVLVLQSKLRKAGRPSPWAGKPRAAGAAAMEAAVRNLILARVRSIAFLKSGWLPAIKVFEPLAKKEGALPAKEGRQYGQAKGRGIPANPGFICRASIENYARTIKDPQFAALRRHGEPALQRAFDDEAASMWEYVKRKMAPDAAAFNAKQK